MGVDYKKLCDELKIRLSEVNTIATYLPIDIQRLLKDATMGRGRKFGVKRNHPIERKLGWKPL